MPSTALQQPRQWSATGKTPLNTRPTDPSSGAYYKVLFPSPQGNARSITAESNSTAVAYFGVPWVDCARFETDALGYSDYVVGQKYLKRRLPLRHGDPAQTSFVLRQLTIQSFHNFDKRYHEVMTIEDGAYSKGWPKTEMVGYRGDFVQRPYPLLEDDDVKSDTVPELRRYITKFPETEAYHRKIPGYGFAFSSNAQLKCDVLASLPEFMQRWIYTTYQWPWSFTNDDGCSVPLDAIARALGTVNASTFDPYLRFRKSDGTTQDGFPAEEFKYENCLLSQPYYGSDDKLYVDIQHIFLWNPRNWNKQVKPNTSPVTYEYVKQLGAGGAFLSPAKYPFVSSDFNVLFKPAGAT